MQQKETITYVTSWIELRALEYMRKLNSTFPLCSGNGENVVTESEHAAAVAG